LGALMFYKYSMDPPYGFLWPVGRCKAWEPLIPEFGRGCASSLGDFPQGTLTSPPSG